MKRRIRLFLHMICFGILITSYSVSADSFVFCDISTREKYIKEIEMSEEEALRRTENASIQSKYLKTKDRSVVGENILFPVYKEASKQLPYSPICYIESIWNVNGKKHISKGTGTIISPSKVLTAGHLVYDYNYGQANEIYVYPGRYQSIFPYGEARGEKISYPKDLEKLNYNDSNTLNYRKCDIAVVNLNIPIGNSTSTIDVAFVPDSEMMALPSRQITITGYPRSGYALGYYDETTDSSNTIDGIMYSSWGKTMRCSGREIRYDVDTRPGMDGAGIVCRDKWSTIDLVTGIDVSYPRETNGYSVGVHIESTYYGWIMGA